MKPLAVESGDAALVRSRQAGIHGDPFPLVCLLYAMMPGMDGFSAGQKITTEP